MGVRAPVQRLYPRTLIHRTAAEGRVTVPRSVDGPAPLFVARLIVFVVILLLWQGSAEFFHAMFWISSPYLVVSRLVKWIGNGYLLPQVAATLEEGLGGFVIGVIIGGTLGILCGYFRLAGRIVEPAIVALYSLPVIALAPLFLLWFGIGQSSKVALAAVTVIFLVFFNTYAGLKNIDEELVSIVRIMGARSTQLVRTVVLPSALTSMFTGFKVALPYALIGAVVGEIISSNKGIGYLIQLASTQFDTTGVFVGLVALATVSVLLSACVRVLEARLMPWRS